MVLEAMAGHKRGSGESLGVRRRLGSDLEEQRRFGVASAVLLVKVAGEEGESGKREKGETRLEMHSKEADKQETIRAKLGEGTVT